MCSRKGALWVSLPRPVFALSSFFSTSFLFPFLALSPTLFHFPFPVLPSPSYFQHFWPPLCRISRLSFQLSVLSSIVHSCFIFFLAFFPSLLPFLLRFLQTGSGVAAGAPDGGAASSRAGSAPKTSGRARRNRLPTGLRSQTGLSSAFRIPQLCHSATRSLDFPL